GGAVLAMARVAAAVVLAHGQDLTVAGRLLRLTNVARTHGRRAGVIAELSHATGRHRRGARAAVVAQAHGVALAEPLTGGAHHRRASAVVTGLPVRARGPALHRPGAVLLARRDELAVAVGHAGRTHVGPTRGKALDAVLLRQTRVAQGRGRAVGAATVDVPLVAEIGVRLADDRQTRAAHAARLRAAGRPAGLVARPVRVARGGHVAVTGGEALRTDVCPTARDVLHAVLGRLARHDPRSEGGAIGRALVRIPLEAGVGAVAHLVEALASEAGLAIERGAIRRGARLQPRPLGVADPRHVAIADLLPRRAGAQPAHRAARSRVVAVLVDAARGPPNPARPRVDAAMGMSVEAMADPVGAELREASTPEARLSGRRAVGLLVFVAGAVRVARLGDIPDTDGGVVGAEVLLARALLRVAELAHEARRHERQGRPVLAAPHQVAVVAHGGVRLADDVDARAVSADPPCRRAIYLVGVEPIGRAHAQGGAVLATARRERIADPRLARR